MFLDDIVARITSAEYIQQQEEKEKRNKEFFNEYKKLTEEFAKTEREAREKKDFAKICELWDQQIKAEKELHERFFH